MEFQIGLIKNCHQGGKIIDIIIFVNNNIMNVNSNTFEELKKYYDKSTYKSSNDEPTPIDCVIEMAVSGSICHMEKKEHSSLVTSKPRKYIPLVYNSIIESILSKTIDNDSLKKFEIKTSSDLHRYTKSYLISNVRTEKYKYRLIDTPKQTVYASRPHKYQDTYKVFISITDKYKVFVDNCGMTQSIAFIICDTFEIANRYSLILQHPLYQFINDIYHWGNFNNIRILQHFPIPVTDSLEDIYSFFNITDDEIEFINNY